MNILPIRSKELLEKVLTLGKADNHTLIYPTHVIKKGDEIRGSLSFMPMVWVWLHQSRNNARDSRDAMTNLENSVAMNNGNVVCMPVHSTSPCFPYVAKFGYIDLGQTNIFVKGL